MKNQIVWVDIPVIDLDRAIGFYSAVLAVEIGKFVGPESTIGFLPGQNGEVSGCLYVSDTAPPSASGVLVYLNCDGRLDKAVSLVSESGGKILVETHPIGPHGFRAIILDSEGNRIALHSQ